MPRNHGCKSILIRSSVAVRCAAVAVSWAASIAAADPREVPESHPLAPALEIARESQRAVEKVKDFEAAFSKRDVVNGEVFADTMRVKFRAEPFSVYLRFAEPHEGREVIYVKGRNGNKILVHETGLASLAGTLAFDPLSPQAMSESRHPITNMGLAGLVDGVIRQWEEETKYGEIEVKYYPNAKLRDMECKVIETSHPQPRRQFKFQMTRLYVDKATNLPVRVEQYGFPSAPGQKPLLLEEYTYWNIRTNGGLTDRDFDPQNPQYGF